MKGENKKESQEFKIPSAALTVCVWVQCVSEYVSERERRKTAFKLLQTKPFVLKNLFWIRTETFHKSSTLIYRWWHHGCATQKQKRREDQRIVRLEFLV